MSIDLTRVSDRAPLFPTAWIAAGVALSC